MNFSFIFKTILSLTVTGLCVLSSSFAVTKQSNGTNTLIATYSGDQISFAHKELVLELASEAGTKSTVTLKFSFAEGLFRMKAFADVKVQGCKSCDLENELVLNNTYRVYDRDGEVHLANFDFFNEFVRVKLSNQRNGFLFFGGPKWPQPNDGSSRAAKGYIDIYRNTKFMESGNWGSYAIYDLQAQEVQFLKYIDSIPTIVWKVKSPGFASMKLYQDDFSILKNDSGVYFMDPQGLSSKLTGGGGIFVPGAKLKLDASYMDYFSGKKRYILCVAGSQPEVGNCSVYKPEEKQLTPEIKDVLRWADDSAMDDGVPLERHALQKGPDNTLRAICTIDYSAAVASPFKKVSQKMIQEIRESRIDVRSKVGNYPEGSYLSAIELSTDSLRGRTVHLELVCPNSF